MCVDVLPKQNKSRSDWGVYTLEFIEFHFLSLNLFLVNGDKVLKDQYKTSYNL